MYLYMFIVKANDLSAVERTRERYILKEIDRERDNETEREKETEIERKIDGGKEPVRVYRE